MTIHIVSTKATPTQMVEMLEAHGTFVKLAVDVHREILAGGGAMHADCEAALLEDGSQQEDVWGADWYREGEAVGFESFINIRPRQQNLSMAVQDPTLRETIERIVMERMKL